MKGVLIVTHGRLGEFLLDTTKMFVDDTTAVDTVSFLEGQGIEDLRSSVRRALEDMASLEAVFCLVDLPGGSPARVLGELVLEDSRLQLITGVNLPMFAEILMLRNSMPVEELVPHAVNSGREGILDIGAAVRDQEDED